MRVVAEERYATISRGFRMRRAQDRKSMKDVSRETGISPSTICRFEKGITHVSAIDLLILWEWAYAARGEKKDDRL